MLEKEDLEPIFKAVVRDLQNQSERLAKIEAALSKKQKAIQAIDDCRNLIRSSYVYSLQDCVLELLDELHKIMENDE